MKHTASLAALALLSGLLLVVIHPDANLYWLAPFALTPLYLVIQREPSWRRRFLLGWLSGIVYWGGMCYWIQGTLARHGGMSVALASFVFVLFALAKGLHSAVFTAIGPRHPLVFAALWAGLERTHATFGFPWLTLGDAGLATLHSLVVPWVGVYGISFALALLATVFTRSRWAALAALVLFLPGSRDSQSGIQPFALSVQPNFDEEAPPRDPAAILLQLSRTTEQPPQLILWPEMPVGLYYEQDTLLRSRIADLGVPLITGTVSFAGLHQPRNSAHFIEARGQAIARYDKMQLVPFGEFVPWPFNTFVDKVSTEAGVFTAGEKVVVARLGEMTVGAFICYESAFPHHVREFTRQGAQLLVNLSNDGYFARSAARGQHLALARMRALENDRWVLRSTNDGYTTSIAPDGSLYEKPATPFQAAAVKLPFEQRGALTPYVRYGDWFAWTCLTASLASIAWAARRRAAAQA
jgi:apolipoprotein N-acyltransferase